MKDRERRSALFRTVRQAIARRLETLSRSVSAELEELAGSAPHHLADVDDLAGTELPEETTLALLELESDELEQLREALARLDGGSYGACADCGAEIPTARLLALPFAARCVACQRAAEAGAPVEGGDGADEASRRENRLARLEDAIAAADRDEAE